MKAVFLDFATLGPDRIDLTTLRGIVPELVIHEHTTQAQVSKRIRDADIVFTNKVRLERGVLETARQLRYIGVLATGTDNIDKVFAADNGIAVTNIRAYCTQSVTEHVFGVLLTLTHSLDRYRRAVRAGDWQRAQTFCLLDYPVRELSSLTLGIVGYGELGRAVERVAKGFGMDVLISARVGDSGAPQRGRVDFGELLRRSDVITLHCPLTDATRGLIGVRELDAMKPDAILINTARGALVDSAALVEALAEGRIGAAAIDVLAVEPPADGDPLLGYGGDNLVLTPHIAWGTIEARQNAVDELTANLSAFLRGDERNRVV